MKTASTMLCVTRKMLLRPACARAAPQVDHLGAQALRGQDVERAERLVHAQHFGLRDQRPREADALAHAAGELLRVGVLVAGQADQLQRPVDLFLFLLAASRRRWISPTWTFSCTVSHG